MRRNTARSSPRNDLPEGPMEDFFTLIESTPPDEWEKRTNSFKILVNSIPTGEAYEAEEAWFNTPNLLRHIATPLNDLLSDARSTVVKRTCEYCSDLFKKCQDDAKYLLKDIMPTILGVHGQTVTVIRNYVETMTLEALTLCRCKMAMPIWIEKLKTDKASTVREACALYLGVGLQEWTEDGYLTDEVYNQVGSALVKALQDSAQIVRANAKKALEIIHYTRPDVVTKLANSGEVIRDSRVRKLLKKIQEGDTIGDDTSATDSRMGSVQSRGTYRGISSGPVRKERVPDTVGIAKGSRIPYSTSRKGGLGPPVRMTTTPAPYQTIVDDVHHEELEAILSSPGKDEQQDLESSFVSDTSVPLIADVNELRETAKLRSNTRTTMLQQRLIQSHSNLEEDNTDKEKENVITNGAPDGESTMEPLSSLVSAAEPATETATAFTPEHLKVAQKLFETHKQHVDQIMETLKVEMEAMKDFETLMSESNEKGPTEDQVLEYYESVDLCLEARTKAGLYLQKKLDKLSQF